MTRFPFDLPLLVLGTLIATTLVAFFAGWFPYPFGVIVLAAFFAARLLHLRARRKDGS